MAAHPSSATTRIADMIIDADVANILLRHNMISAKDVLNHSPLDLMELLDVSYAHALFILTHISQHVAPPYTSGLHLYFRTQDNSNALLTSLPGLDQALRRGLPCGAITEVVGPAGVGKSQFCFMNTLNAAMPRSHGGIEGTVIYIDTEKKFSSQRLVEMCRSRHPVDFASWSSIEPVLTRVLLMAPDTPEEMLRMLQTLGATIEARDVKLVVIDSIAALLRLDFQGHEQMSERQELLGRQAAMLKLVAERFNIPVLVTNQVAARVEGGPGAAAAQRPGGQLKAALGTKWAHCVNVRLVLERYHQYRFIKVAKSPASANVVFGYQVTPRGLEQDMSVVVPEAVQQSVLDMSIANEMDG